MTSRRYRKTHAFRPLALVLFIAIGIKSANGQNGHASPVLPANAIPLPGQTEYPVVGHAQKRAIVKEAVAGTLKETAHRPIRSLAVVINRSAERLGVRACEITSRLGSARPWAHGSGTGDLDARRGSPPLAATLILLPSSESAVQGLLARVGSARRRVDLMIYGWEDDPTGREVASALEAAAARGVQVRVIVDRGGWLIHNAAAASHRPTFLDRLKAVPDVTVIEPADSFLRFDHRKLAVIDGRTAWTGGMILTEVARRTWENLAFLAEGPVAGQYAAVFEERWREVGGTPSGPLAAEPSVPVPLPNANVRLIRTDTLDRSLKTTIYHAVDRARHHIYLENPYFSDTILAEKLIAASRRGVDVRAVVTLRGNVPRLNQYVTLTASRLWRGGVHVYLAPKMTHVKAMSVDGAWAYLGTGNFDELSLRNNREVGLSVMSRSVVSMLDQSIFLPDMARAEALAAPLPPPKNWPMLELLKLWF